MQVAQRSGCHAGRSILVTWHDVWSQELVVAVWRELDVQANAVVHSETHELTHRVKDNTLIHRQFRPF